MAAHGDVVAPVSVAALVSRNDAVAVFDLPATQSLLELLPVSLLPPESELLDELSPPPQSPLAPPPPKSPPPPEESLVSCEWEPEW